MKERERKIREQFLKRLTLDKKLSFEGLAAEMIDEVQRNMEVLQKSLRVNLDILNELADTRDIEYQKKEAERLYIEAKKAIGR